ncbi:hypothetical protein KZZ52_11545 [Dactylosporangium sp. AC04546]|uniref:hypothetical protein n=1 Tax=Dactylosporangium sp. AC04546 TaxID=2862460 RepID=UPI001EE1235F|nr:hypothetical protein [Dactylosporangium sp. AC04546]WVK85982.1 hypothetical protein KZZ52_11545 [Dactylosporangium sp. AC04546]
MDRRSLLVAAGAVGITAAVGGTAAASAALVEHGPRPLVLWELTGGFVPAGWDLLRAPRLAAYDDGVVIADAARRLRIGGGALRSLRNHATTVLRDRSNSRRRPGAPVIADVPTTVFTARAAGRRFSLRFEGLEETRTDKAYPAPAYALLDHLSSVRDRALAVGSPWRPSAVRMVAVVVSPVSPNSSSAASAASEHWPAGVPVPQLGKDEFVARLDLHDRQAHALLRAVPQPDLSHWPVFRTPAGVAMQVNWRYLLPHE